MDIAEAELCSTYDLELSFARSTKEILGGLSNCQLLEPTTWCTVQVPQGWTVSRPDRDMLRYYVEETVHSRGQGAVHCSG